MALQNLVTGSIRIKFIKSDVLDSQLQELTNGSVPKNITFSSIRRGNPGNIVHPITP